jgi:hypothetical protein
VTSQHILYYCTYYSVSCTCTVHCTYFTYCTLYMQYMFPVSLFPMLRFHLQHLFTILVHTNISIHTYTCSHFIKYSHTSVHLVSFTTVNKHICISLVLGALHHRGSATERLPAFAGSRYGRQSNLSLQQTATTRMLQFSSRPQPRLSKANFANTDVHSFIEHIHQLIRAEAFDETVMETHIDEESIHYLATLFATTTVATARPIPTYWTVDWDVATIIEALEELYPLRAEHRHLSICGSARTELKK